MAIAERDVYMSSGYFADPQRHSEDAEFKAGELAKLLASNRSLADVGCGSGAATIAMVRLMQRAGYQLTRVSGYDISPHIRGVSHPFIRFVHEGFTTSATRRLWRKWDTSFGLSCIPYRRGCG